MSKSGGIISTLIQHYGRLILSTPGAPGDWKSGINSTNFEKYERYVGLAKPHAYPELYIFFQMLIEDLQRPENGTTVRAIINEIDDLNAGDLANFLQFVEQYATNSISSESTAETTRASERVVAFLEKYQNTRKEFRVILNAVKSNSSS